MDKKLNGFNNGRDTTKGIGGKDIIEHPECNHEWMLCGSGKSHLSSRYICYHCKAEQEMFREQY